MSPLLSEHFLSESCIVLDIPSDAVALETAELSQALGYPSREPPPGMAELIRSTAQDIQALCELRAGYAIVPLSFDPKGSDSLLLGTRLFQTGKIIRTQMEGAGTAALFICTIGPGPEQRVKELLAAGEAALGYIADTTASVLAEKVAEAVHVHLEAVFASKGFCTTNRFSPGYCGWDVREQHELFRLLPEGFCGVRLEDSAFMQPRKSISAMVGIGKALKRMEYPCAKCDDNQCLYRKET